MRHYWLEEILLKNLKGDPTYITVKDPLTR